MFDAKAEIVIPFDSPDGIKKIAVRFPTDAEFIDWRKKKKIVQRDLGRRSFQIENTKPERADLELISKIRLDKDTGPAIDEAEAVYVIGRLAQCEVTERPERVGNTYSIHMKVMGKLDTTHVLNVPSMKQMFDYDRVRSGVVHGEYGRSEIRINFQASADLYNELKVSVDGYGDFVPVPHKAEAVSVLLQEIRSRQEEEPEGDAGDEDEKG